MRGGIIGVMPNPKKKQRKPTSNDRLQHMNQQLAIIKRIAVVSTEQLKALAEFVNDRTEYAVAFEHGQMRIFAKPEPEKETVLGKLLREGLAEPATSGPMTEDARGVVTEDAFTPTDAEIDVDFDARVAMIEQS